MKSKLPSIVFVLVVLLTNLLINFTVIAQTPQQFKYQAVLRDASGNIMASQAKTIIVDILKDSTTGPRVFTETHHITSSAQGIINLNIGSINTTGVATINWANSTYFIKIIVDSVVMGTSQLLSVPYALYAKTAGAYTTAHYIGELFGGGIVVSVWKEVGKEYGLIASLENIGSGTVWSNNDFTLIGVTAQSPSDGITNSSAITGQPCHTISAASVCADYRGGGFNDWYLPAIWELKECYNAVYIINTILGASNGFALNSTYWSSTEYNNQFAMWIDIRSGSISYTYKSFQNSVRAVRRF